MIAVYVVYIWALDKNPEMPDALVLDKDVAEELIKKNHGAYYKEIEISSVSWEMLAIGAKEHD